MQIDIIASNTIKITLNKADMLCYDFRFDRIDCNSPEMKEFIVDMVDTIKDKQSIDLDAQKLYIEAFPKKDGGCLIYISPLEEKISPSFNSNLSLSEIIVDFTDIEELIHVSKILCEKYLHYISQSCLYNNLNTYRIVTYVYVKAENKIKGILGEYGSVIEKSTFGAASTNEYYNVLIKTNAVKTLGNL